MQGQVIVHTYVHSLRKWRNTYVLYEYILCYRLISISDHILMLYVNLCCVKPVQVLHVVGAISIATMRLDTIYSENSPSKYTHSYVVVSVVDCKLCSICNIIG